MLCKKGMGFGGAVFVLASTFTKKDSKYFQIVLVNLLGKIFSNFLVGLLGTTSVSTKNLRTMLILI